MNVLFYIVGMLLFLVSILIAAGSQTAIHEIQAILVLMTASFCVLIGNTFTIAKHSKPRVNL